MGQRAKAQMTETLRHLPYVGDIEALDEANSQRIIAILRRLNANIPDAVGAQVVRIIGEIDDELPRDAAGNFILSSDQLMGVVSRSAVRGASQVLWASAGSLQEASQLEEGLDPRA